MTSWMEIARARFQVMDASTPAKTDEKRVLSVLAVPVTREEEAGVVVPSVLSVGDVAVLENTSLLQELMAAAMHCCDVHGDGPQARAQMREEVMATPPELQADLLDHFKTTYGAPNERTRTR